MLSNALFAAMSSTGRAFVLLAICTALFAIVGVGSFHGNLRHGCHRLGTDGFSWEPTGDLCNPLCDVDTVSQRLVAPCASFGNRTLGLAAQTWGFSCLPGERCLCATNASETNELCRSYDNPNDGLTTFDQSAGGALAFMMVIGKAGWGHSVMFNLGARRPARLPCQHGTHSNDICAATHTQWPCVEHPIVTPCMHPLMRAADLLMLYARS